ncbi:MAG: CNNM domain-containing protein, partial [Longimicrobiales bacterium]
MVAIALGIAILLSGVLSAAELAIFSMPESRVRALANQGSRTATALAQLRERPERVLVLLRLGDALADVSAGALTAWLVYTQFELSYVALAVGGAAFAVLYIGELFPIGFAINHGTRFALAIAAPLLVVTRVLSPLLIGLATIANMRTDRRERGANKITELEIRQLTALGQSEGAITEHERELIERAFRMDETKAWDIMTPRVDIIAWDGALPLAEIAAELGDTRYSRVPVFDDTVDNVVGVLYVRDAYT